MRVLMLAGRDALHPRAGGGDVQAWAWAKWLAAKGHTVIFVCQSSASLASEETLCGVQIVRLGTGARLAIRAWRRYWPQRDSFDLFYEDPIGAGRTPFLSPLWSATPTIAVWHQVSGVLFKDLHSQPVASALSITEKILAFVYRPCFFWAPSNEVAAQIVAQLAFAPDHVRVIHPTVDAVIGSARLAERPRRRIAVLGVFRTYKAMDHVISALPSVIERIPGVVLTVAGRRADDEYLQQLVKLAKSLGVAGNVEFALDLSESAKADLLDSTDVLVLPSLLEGYGIVSIEANAVGVPVVASSGVPLAAVQDGKNGLRYDFGDIASLSDRIVACLTDDEVYRRLSEGAVEWARQRTVEAMGFRFDDLMSVALAAVPPWRVRRSHARRSGMGDRVI